MLRTAVKADQSTGHVAIDCSRELPEIHSVHGATCELGDSLQSVMLNVFGVNVVRTRPYTVILECSTALDVNEVAKEAVEALKGFFGGELSVKGEDELRKSLRKLSCRPTMENAWRIAQECDGIAKNPLLLRLLHRDMEESASKFSLTWCDMIAMLAIYPDRKQWVKGSLDLMRLGVGDRIREMRSSL